MQRFGLAVRGLGFERPLEPRYVTLTGLIKACHPRTTTQGIASHPMGKNLEIDLRLGSAPLQPLVIPHRLWFLGDPEYRAEGGPTITFDQDPAMAPLAASLVSAGDASAGILKGALIYFQSPAASAFLTCRSLRLTEPIS